jgi:hypothetical protein
MSEAMGDNRADPLAKGVISTAKQSFKDLFKWKQRVVVTDPQTGEESWKWQDPEPLQNPIKLFSQLSLRDVRFQFSSRAANRES